MRFRLTFVVIVLAALATGGPSAQSQELDNRTITCREFLASGQANMAALISWLRGYHAGKTGVIPLSIIRPLRRQAGLLLQATPGCQPHRRLRTNSDDDRSWYLTGRVARIPSLAKIGAGLSLPLGGRSLSYDRYPNWIGKGARLCAQGQPRRVRIPKCSAEPLS